MASHTQSPARGEIEVVDLCSSSEDEKTPPARPIREVREQAAAKPPGSGSCAQDAEPMNVANGAGLSTRLAISKEPKQPLNDQGQVQRFITNLRKLYRVKQTLWQSEQLQANLASVTRSVEATTQQVGSRRGGTPLGASTAPMSVASRHKADAELPHAQPVASTIKAFHQTLRENVPQGQQKKLRSAVQSSGSMYSRTAVVRPPGELDISTPTTTSQVKYTLVDPVNSQRSQLTLHAAVLQFVTNVPTYTTWLPITINEQMQEDTRRRLLYADHDGEMIAGSDTDDSDAEQAEQTDNRNWERGDDFVLQATAAAFAWDDSLRDQLSVEFNMPVSRVVQRYKDLEMMQSLPVLPKNVLPKSLLNEAVKAMREGAQHFAAWDAAAAHVLEPAEAGAEAGYAAMGTAEATSSNTPRKSKGLRNRERDEVPTQSTPFDTLHQALDSFRTLFCRRCCVFDCRTHRCGQFVPKKQTKSETLPPPPPPEDAAGCPSPRACGARCFRMRRNGSQPVVATTLGKRAASAECDAAMGFLMRAKTNQGVVEERGEGEGQVAQAGRAGMRADQRKAGEEEAGKESRPVDNWKPLEQELFTYAITMFGLEDSCACARLLGTRSCAEVKERLDVLVAQREAGEGSQKLDQSSVAATQARKKFGRKLSKKRNAGITVRLRWEQAKGGEEDEYHPCTCEGNGACGTSCECVRDGNFCEKYCKCTGCADGECPNRFPGCNCLKGQCRTRACPCFAAQRECDPDKCKRCTQTAATVNKRRIESLNSTLRNIQGVRDAQVGTTATGAAAGSGMEAVAMAAAAAAAGAASAGATVAESCASDALAPASGLGASGHVAKGWDWNDPQLYCQNMKLRLRQHRQICMGLSDVAGWGAFVNHGVKKDDLLGEYTGELITHGEADRRGKVYDRSNSSFLFNLNDQWVLDAQLRGNKLKFANHSAQANCYAKVLMIDGDHRVGIFAKVDMKAGTELFYDYRYEKDKAPPWAKDRFDQQF